MFVFHTIFNLRAAVAVGVTAVSYRDILEDGMRGKAVLINHMYTDLLWYVFPGDFVATKRAQLCDVVTNGLS